jgi:uncharacterized membrane protein
MASLVLCTAAIFTGAGAQGDNLGVAGFLSGWRLTVATFAPLLVLPLTIVALVALFTTLRRSPTSVS